METNFVLNVITRCLDGARLSPRPLFERFVRARRRFPLFKRRDPCRPTTMLTQGPQFSRLVPVGEYCPSKRCLERKKNVTTRCDQMRSCTDSRVCTHQRARRGSEYC